jgi:hypothetical protein
MKTITISSIGFNPNFVLILKLGLTPYESDTTIGVIMTRLRNYFNPLRTELKFNFLFECAFFNA